MGTVKRDLERKGRQYEESYPYEATGIAALLRDVYRLSESRLYDGDIDATAILIDLKMALDSICLTPRMRQVVALYYFAQFTEGEVADVIGLTQQGINDSLNNALERISAHMEYGYTKVTNAKVNAILPDTDEIKRWLNAVAYGKEVYEIDDEVISGINKWRASKLNDAKDLEAIRQRIEGYTYEPVYENEEQKYPALTWEQIRWRDRRMTFVEEVHPQRDTVGFRKVATKLEDNNNDPREWNLERKRLFI
jgi:predicted DNA-binding protein YlxM (UPF0122 family)